MTYKNQYIIYQYIISATVVKMEHQMLCMMVSLSTSVFLILNAIQKLVIIFSIIFMSPEMTI